LIVLDSSAAVDYLAGAAAGDWVADSLRADPELHAPHLLDIEVLAALRRLLLTGRIGAARASDAARDLRALPIRRYPHVPLLERVWALRETVTAADAAFVALAEALGASLLTTDLRLARAPGLSVPVLSPDGR
jgi:predicted nucleic acid-binding protein